MKRSREPSNDDSKHLDPRSPTPRDDDLGSSVESSPPLPAVKLVHLDIYQNLEQKTVMKCSLPPHRESLSFPSYEDYEAHYNKAHTNRCLECRKNFPSEHLLGIHIEECHDSFAAVRRERGEHTFSCFMEGCDRKCLTPQKRRLHMIDKHGYPRNYFFALTKEGIDGRRSLLIESGHRRVSSGASIQTPPKTTRNSKRRPSMPDATKEVNKPGEEPKDADNVGNGTIKAEGEKPDSEMADLTSAMSALQFVPAKIRFGRGGGRVGFAKTR